MLPSMKSGEYGWSFTCRATLGVNGTFTYRRQRGVCPKEQSGIHKKHWPGIIWKEILPLCPPIGEGYTKGSGLRKSSKSDRQRSVVCIRELQYVDGEWELLRKNLEGVSFGQSPYPEDTDARWHSPRLTRLSPFSLNPLSPLAQGGEVRNSPKKRGRQSGRREAADKAPPPPQAVRPEAGLSWESSEGLTLNTFWNFEIVLDETRVMWLQAWAGLFYKFSPQLSPLFYKFSPFWCLIRLLSFQLQLLKWSSPEIVWPFKYLLNHFYSPLFLAHIFKPLFYFFNSVKYRGCPVRSVVRARCS